MDYKVSIILPIYNVANYLRRCIDSVISQSLKDIEIILASDGPEECDEICKEYHMKDDRIRLISHPGSYGKAVNAGIKSANGKYIGIVETDDWCDTTMFEKLYNKAEQNNADVVKCGFYLAYNDVAKNQSVVFEGYNKNMQSFKDCPEFMCFAPSVWCCIYKKSFLNENDLLFISNRMSFVDSPFHELTFALAKKYLLLCEPLYFYYQDNSSQSVKVITEKGLYDGLESEKIAYKLISSQFKQSTPEYQYWICAASCHMLWNVDRIKDKKMKKEFWYQAHLFFKLLSYVEVPFNYYDYGYIYNFIRDVQTSSVPLKGYYPQPIIIRNIKRLYRRLFK